MKVASAAAATFFLILCIFFTICLSARKSAEETGKTAQQSVSSSMKRQCRKAKAFERIGKREKRLRQEPKQAAETEEQIQNAKQTSSTSFRALKKKKGKPQFWPQPKWLFFSTVFIFVSPCEDSWESWDKRRRPFRSWSRSRSSSALVACLLQDKWMLHMEALLPLACKL